MKAALLVVDCLNDFLDLKGALNCGAAGRDAIPAVAREIAQARAEGMDVLYACDAHRPDDAEFELFPPHCLMGSWGAEIVPELRPQDGDRIIAKRRFSAFYGTDLDLTLRERAVDTLRIAGVCTNICVLYTTADARMRGYDVRIPVDAVASFDPAAHHFALGQLRDVLKASLEGTGE